MTYVKLITQYIESQDIGRADKAPCDLKVTNNKHGYVGGKCILYLSTAEVYYMCLIYFGPGGILLKTDPKNIQLFEIPKRFYIYTNVNDIVRRVILQAPAVHTKKAENEFRLI